MISDIESFKDSKYKDIEKIKSFVRDFIKIKEDSKLESKLHELSKRYHIMPSKNQLRNVYETFFSDIMLPPFLTKYLILKSMRSRSGVLVSTIVLKPSKFSCTYQCAYCPTETDLVGNPTQPKSYLSSEPAMLRALQYDFDVKGQFHDRINSYIKTGNIKLDNNHSYKFEIIISGGTWESYPYSYRNQVMNEMYWAANTYFEKREMKSIEEEISINETTQFRIIGLTIETRPDNITKQTIKDYRRWGITRIQIGVQHYDDDILRLLKRDCETHHTIQAIHLLKQTGFKVVCHLMPDLPGSSPSKDRWMFHLSIYNPLLQFDDVKIYPTAICQSDNPNLIITSDIATWYKEGSYQPYSEQKLSDLIDILKEYKTSIQPWVRIQRLVRDIPSQSIEAGYNKYSNLRQMIHDEMKKEGTRCNCIRCMEVGDIDSSKFNTKLVVRKYNASYGIEYFISYELYPKEWDWEYFFYLIQYIIGTVCGYTSYWSGNMNKRQAIIGFCRLRIDPNPGGGFIKELENCGLIRELHVYSTSLGIGSNVSSLQHNGFGQKLLKVAENIIVEQSSFRKSAVISGIGVRQYYQNKCGYHKEGTYMIKHLEKSYFYIYLILIISIINYLIF